MLGDGCSWLEASVPGAQVARCQRRQGRATVTSKSHRKTLVPFKEGEGAPIPAHSRSLEIVFLTLCSSPRSPPAILPPSSSRPPLGPPGSPPSFHPLPRQGGDSGSEGRASLRWGQDSPRQAWEKRVSRSCFLSRYVTTEGSKEVREPRVQRDRRSPEPSQSVRLRTAATAVASFK